MTVEDRVRRSAADATADWLSDALGVRVTGVDAREETSSWARHVRLAATVDGEPAPRRLRLKICLGDTFGRSEVDYYRRDYVGVGDAPLVPCRAAGWEPGVGYHLLLDDLSETHAPCWDGARTPEAAARLADSLAALHAPWWGRVAPPDDAAWERYAAAVLPGLEPMAAALELGAANADALRRRVADDLAALRARCADPVGMTLVHGDPNPGNVLAPVSGDGPALLLDRQPFDWSLTRWLGAHDLAYALAVWWPSETRAAWEPAAVSAWHAGLEARGVRGYPIGRAWDDWRLAVAQCLHVPIEWCVDPQAVSGMRWVWEPQWRRLADALAL